MDDPPLVKFRYTISGVNLPFEKLTEIGGVKPNKLWRKGDLIIPSGLRVYEADGWQISTNRIAGWYVEQLLDDFFSRNQLPNEKLTNFCFANNLQQTIGIVIDISTGSPAITLTPSLLALLAKHKITVDFDIYLVQGKIENIAG